MSSESEADVSEVLERWSKAMPSVGLRWEACPDSDDGYAVLIGRGRLQALALELRPRVGWGELTGSQFVERFSSCQARVTTPWDDHWTEVGDRGTSLHEWLEHALARVVSAHLEWELEAVFEAYDEGKTLLRLCRGLVEAEAMGIERLRLDDSVASLLPMARVLLRASGGSMKAVRTLVKLAKRSTQGMDDSRSVRALLVGAGSRCLSGEARSLFEDKMTSTVRKDARRIVEASVTYPKRFQALKMVMDHATPDLHEIIARAIEELAHEGQPASEEDRKLQARISRYNTIFRDWQTLSPTCKNPTKEGRAFVELENSINASWWQRLERASELMRPTLQARLVSDGRFLSGATGTVVGWLRSQHRYNEAVALTCACFADLELVVLQHGSQTLSFENMVNNAFGAFLDSGREEHIAMAIEILDRVEGLFAWETGLCDYQLACVYARAGRVEESLEALGRIHARGNSVSRALRDSDLVTLHEHPTLLGWIA